MSIARLARRLKSRGRLRRAAAIECIPNVLSSFPGPGISRNNKPRQRPLRRPEIRLLADEDRVPSCQYASKSLRLRAAVQGLLIQTDQLAGFDLTRLSP